MKPNILQVEIEGECSGQIRQEQDIIINDLCHEGCLYPVVVGEISEINLVLVFEITKLTLKFTDKSGGTRIVIISLSPYIKYIREYKEICIAYKQALSHSTAASIETIDMARRGVHNQAAEYIQEKLSHKVQGNHQAFRLLFSIMVLRFKNK